MMYAKKLLLSCSYTSTEPIMSTLTLSYWLTFFVNHTLPNYPYCGSEIGLSSAFLPCIQVHILTATNGFSDQDRNQYMASLLALSLQYKARKKARWIGTLCFKKRATLWIKSHLSSFRAGHIIVSRIDFVTFCLQKYATFYVRVARMANVSDKRAPGAILQ